jgi:hypothetical protein
MKRVKLIATALVLTALALAGGVAAQETNTQERTFLTFSNAVEMPGVTLQAGTYVFKLADTPSRNVVQVFDRDEKNIIGQWLFVQAERPEVTGENVVMFRETREGSTPAIQFWYFPGEKIGKEFIYPKDQAQRIAARTGASVRTEDGVVEGAGLAGIQAEARTEVSAEAAAQPAPEPAPSPEPEPAAAAEPPAQAAAEPVSPEPAPVAQADVEAPRAVGTSGQAEGQVARADELPRTASPLALSGLLGLLALAGAAGIRAFRK